MQYSLSSQLVMKFLAFNETRRFITMITKACQIQGPEGEFLAPTQPKLQDHTPSVIHDSLFNTFAVSSVSGGHLLDLQLEDVPCHGDKGPA
jgi:hypothetical protein